MCLLGLRCPPLWSQVLMKNKNTAKKVLKKKPAAQFQESGCCSNKQAGQKKFEKTKLLSFHRTVALQSDKGAVVLVVKPSTEVSYGASILVLRHPRALQYGRLSTTTPVFAYLSKRCVQYFNIFSLLTNSANYNRILWSVFVCTFMYFAPF